MLAGLLLATGCTSCPAVDPLKGELHPQNANNYGPNPAVRSASSNRTFVGTDPLLGSGESLAPITHGRPPLAISDPVASEDLNNASSSAWESGPKVLPLSEQPPGSVSPAMPTSEMLQAQLRARGVIWQKAETLPEGVRFTCVVPNRYDPENCRAYAATTPDFVTAIQAVLLEIDQP